MSSKPRLFIGSSSEKLRVAGAMQKNLDRQLEVTVWTQGIFQPSKTTMESLLQALDNFDAAAFVFAPDDVTFTRGASQQTVRDNVSFELGLFIGRLGREKCFVVCPRGVDLHFPTDLLGITPITYETDRQDDNIVAALGLVCFEITEALSGGTYCRIDAPGSSFEGKRLTVRGTAGGGDSVVVFWRYGGSNFWCSQKPTALKQTTWEQTTSWEVPIDLKSAHTYRDVVALVTSEVKAKQIIEVVNQGDFPNREALVEGIGDLVSATSEEIKLKRS